MASYRVANAEVRVRIPLSALGDRLTVGRRALIPVMKVRILLSEIIMLRNAKFKEYRIDDESGPRSVEEARDPAKVEGQVRLLARAKTVMSRDSSRFGGK